MNFFKILFSLCSGTGVFPRLVGIPLWRAFMHLLFLMVLCTLLIAGAGYIIDRLEVMRLTDSFFDETGGITLTPDTVTLGKKPQEYRGYTLGKMRFDYCPGDTFLRIRSKIKNWKTPVGIVCLNSGIAIWVRDPGNGLPGFRVAILDSETLYSLFAADMESLDSLYHLSDDRMKLYSPDEMSTQIENVLLKKKPETKKPGDDAARPYRLTESEVSGQILLLLATFNFLFVLAEIGLLLCLALVFFTLAQTFRASALPHKLAFRTVLTLTIYTTFPPLVVASIFAACQLKLLSFQMVFFIAYFIYQLFAFNTVFRHFNPPGRNASLDDDDSDF